MWKLVAQDDLVALDILPWGGKLGPAQMLGDKLEDRVGRRVRGRRRAWCCAGRLARGELWLWPKIWLAAVGMRWGVDYLFLLLP
jgi:hypothetical protein